jgi:hypothetical protein
MSPLIGTDGIARSRTGCAIGRPWIVAQLLQGDLYLGDNVQAPGLRLAARGCPVVTPLARGISWGVAVALMAPMALMGFNCAINKAADGCANIRANTAANYADNDCPFN